MQIQVHDDMIANKSPLWVDGLWLDFPNGIGIVPRQDAKFG